VDFAQDAAGGWGAGRWPIIQVPKVADVEAQFEAGLGPLLRAADANGGDVVHREHQVLLQDGASKHKVHLQQPTWQCHRHEQGVHGWTQGSLRAMRL
jgi:hypothetical protein